MSEYASTKMYIIFNSILIVSVFYGSFAENETVPSDKKVREIDNSRNFCGYEGDELKVNLNKYNDFALNMFIKISEETNANFIFSPASVILVMSALAEGSDNRTEIDNAIGLPRDRCVKQRYYKLIQSKERRSFDISLVTTRALVIDESLRLKQTWREYIPAQYRLNVLSAPIRRKPLSAAYGIRQITNVQFQNLNLTGNSVLLDSMDYKGLWQKTFPQLLLRQPFYDSDGEQIGWVDMMSTNIRVRMSYIDEIKIKVLEMPVGIDGRYRMIFTQFTEKVDYIEILKSVNENMIKAGIDRLVESKIPIHVEIPRFNLDSELDMRKVLEKLGINSIWTDPSVTRHIADGPVLPSSYIQRTNVFIDTAGANPPTPDLLSTNKAELADTGLDPAIGREFIANKHMFFGLFDAELYTTLYLGSYEVPTYSL